MPGLRLDRNEMNGKKKRRTMEELRQDPDYQALVSALRRQSSEQVDAFYERYDGSQRKEGDHERDDKAGGLPASPRVEESGQGVAGDHDDTGR